ncbi:acyl carrier protein [Nonlabens xiamenensis]|uniref:acyl carrier protein n=1 Tax=Nonlabens xiamenensis TaxID=2341043 RepID=UPI000F60EE5A|nr:phosphopantetheine-binding protein [Nonlabens xiamenensis]
MTDQQIEESLFRIVKVYLPQDVSADAIQRDSHLMQDLGINSAHLVDIALDVEDEFDIMLQEPDMEEMQTVEDAIRIVNKKISTTESSQT